MVWPEPTSSAAGWRMMQLIELFHDLEFNIIFASAAQKTDRSFKLNSIGVTERPIELNNASFDVFIKDISPSVVIFDRFITEEQFGWRVAEQVPDAIRILDAEDFHGLRKGREQAFKEGGLLTTDHLQNSVTKRELTSMYRCDLTLVISEAEIDVLTKQFDFPEALLLYHPFVIDDLDLKSANKIPGFEQRTHFITVGNYRHAPNADSLDYLKKDIWPLIRSLLPEAELHIYGAYQSNRANQLHNEKDGFLIKGEVPDISKVMTHYRVCLAPLRFGAGLKGKLFDAMKTGTPSVMSKIAAEGLYGALSPNGFIENDEKMFSRKSVELYSTSQLWHEKQQNGFDVLESRFQKNVYLESLGKCLTHLKDNLSSLRQKNFIGQLFLQQSMQVSRYLSKWIEAKNK